MKLYFLRHADALPDGERPLSDKGVKQSQWVGRALVKLGVEPAAIYTSPLLRARETAQIVGDELGPQPIITDRLDSGADLDDIAAIAEDSGPEDEVLLVGHEPDFSACVGELIGSATIEMKKAGVALVECRAVSAGMGQLLWLAPPKLLR